MSILDGYLIEIERETQNTKRILDKISDEHLDWQPHPKSMSLGALAAHIVELHNWIHQAISMDEFDFQKHYKSLKVSSVEELKNELSNQFEHNVQTLKSFSDEDWMKTWTLRSGSHVIKQIPKVGALRFIIQNHLIHHRGQITVYLRMLNIAVPGLYGPSADEQ